MTPGSPALGAVVCHATVLYVRKERKAHLSKYSLHFLELSEEVNMISLHVYVHKCFVHIQTYKMWIYMHIFVCMYVHYDMYITYAKAQEI